MFLKTWFARLNQKNEKRVKPKQVLVLLLPLCAAVALLIWGDTIPDHTKPAPQASTAGANAAPISAGHVLEKARQQLTKQQLDTLAQQELALKRARSTDEQQRLLVRLAERWKRTGFLLPAAHYYQATYELNQQPEWLQKAADLYFAGFMFSSDSIERTFGAQQAAQAYNQLYALDSGQVQYRIQEALCRIEGLNEVMQGVMLLKEVEKVYPDHVQVNLILARLSIVSGQFDKAIARLENVIRQEPDNAEAFFHLATAYRALGKLPQAIEAYTRCQALVDDPTFDNQIAQLIEQIKKS